MAVIVTSKDPKSLLDKIKAKIRSGEITSWKMDADGDFYLASIRISAWFTSKININQIIFTTLPTRSRTITITNYATYHGKLVEMLLSHFDKDFTDVSATAMPSNGDIVKGSDAPSSQSTLS